MAEQLTKTLRILRHKQLRERSGLGRSSIYERLNPKSVRYDPSFPKPITLGYGSRARGFLESEFDDWIRLQVDASRNKRKVPR